MPGTGRVVEFSADRGLGTIEDDDGRAYLFHVVEIADGTRDIEVGCSVWFQTLPKFGSLEACCIRKL